MAVTGRSGNEAAAETAGIRASSSARAIRMIDDLPVGCWTRSAGSVAEPAARDGQLLQALKFAYSPDAVDFVSSASVRTAMPPTLGVFDSLKAVFQSLSTFTFSSTQPSLAAPVCTTRTWVRPLLEVSAAPAGTFSLQTYFIALGPRTLEYGTAM